MKQTKPNASFVERSNPKAKARQLAAEWEDMLKRHAKPLVAGNRVKSVAQPVRVSEQSMRETGPHIRSLNSMQGSTAKQQPKVYTGTSMIGIAQMHKSNAVPVFRKEDAVAVAQMRR